MGKGKKVGYVRVSTIEQKTERQLDGIELDRIFEDKAPGKDVKRPQLDELLKYVRDGDIVYVHSMDRLARNLDDLRRLVNQLTKKQVKVEFVKESITFSGEDAPMSTLLLSIMGAFAEFERALIRERQMEGIALAKKRGAYRGRKPALSPEEISNLKEQADQGVNKAQLARAFGISRETLYKYLRVKHKAENSI